ncbi:MAG: ABC transporter permease subunit [Chloroflexi bacterium]|nr:ABC transporter permease subunit [Chloroflexota bacterium]
MLSATRPPVLVASSPATVDAARPFPAGVRRRRRRLDLLAFLPLGVLLVGLIGLPMLGVVVTSLLPSRVVGAGTLANYGYLLTRAPFLEALARTLLVSGAVTLLATLLAIPTALALDRLPPSTRQAGALLLLLPILVGPLVLALGWLAVLSGSRPLGPLGIVLPRLVGHESGTVVGLVGYTVPFVTLVLLAGLARLDPAVVAAASLDGAGRWRGFRSVTWPLILPSLAGGALLAMLLAMSAYVTPQYLGGGARPVLTTVIAQYVLGTFDRPLAATAAVVLVVVTTGLALVWWRPPVYVIEEQGRRDRTGYRDRHTDYLSAGWLILAGGLMLLPLATIVAGSFSPDALFPALPTGVSVRWYQRILTDSTIASATGLSLGVAVAATVLATLVALPAAIRLARRGPTWLTGLATAPFAAPQLVVSLAILGGVVVLGLAPAPHGLVLAHAAFVTPVVLRAVLASLEGLDPALTEAAAVDGAGELRTVASVLLPSIGPGLGSGAALAFVLSFTNVPLSLFLATPRAMPLPILMLSRLETGLDPGLAALSVLLMAAVLPAGLFAARLGLARSLV